MAFCNMCGAQIADGMTTCAACSGKAAAPAAVGAQGMTDNMAGLLAYVTFIPAIIFLVMEPYNRSKFIRFHAFQSLFLFGGAFVAHIGLMIIAVVPFMIFITAPLHLLITLGTIVIAIILALKANQNQMYKFPIIGELAAKQAGTV